MSQWLVSFYRWGLVCRIAITITRISWVSELSESPIRIAIARIDLLRESVEGV
jgi:hypothetical protein